MGEEGEEERGEERGEEIEEEEWDSGADSRSIRDAARSLYSHRSRTSYVSGGPDGDKNEAKK